MDVNLSLNKIAEIVGGEVSSADSSFVINRIESLEKATDKDLAIILDRGDASVFDAVSAEKIKACKAGCFLTFTADLLTDKNYILVKDSVAAFQKLINFIYKMNLEKKQSTQISPDAVVDPSAIISDGVKIGAGTCISALVFIGKDCVIGSNVLLHPGVKVLDGCKIGDGTIIHSGTVIGADGFGYKVTKKGLVKIPQIGIVKIGRDVEIGANCTIDRASFDETEIGDGVKMDNLVHIAHNVKIGACTAILAQTGIAGSAIIGVGCQIGGQVAIKNDIRIGNSVKIVSKSAVMESLDNGVTVCGIPAISFMQWKRISVLVSKLPEFAKYLEASKRSWFSRMLGLFKK